MNKKIDPNTKHYFQTTSEKELAEALSKKFEGKQSFPITLWEKGEEEKDAEIYNLFEFDQKNKTLFLNAIGKLLSTLTGSVKAGKSILIKIPIDPKTNFFTGGILVYQREKLSYSIQIQQEIFVSQQRSNFRLNANSVIQIQFKANNIVYDALDISIGGTSFTIENSNPDNLAKGQMFEECILRFDRKNYLIPKAQITSIMPILDENGKATNKSKVGIAFKDLNQNIADELHVKISVEARGDEMKKKFDAIFTKS